MKIVRASWKASVRESTAAMKTSRQRFFQKSRQRLMGHKIGRAERRAALLLAKLAVIVIEEFFDWRHERSYSQLRTRSGQYRNPWMAACTAQYYWLRFLEGWLRPMVETQTVPEWTTHPVGGRGLSRSRIFLQSAWKVEVCCFEGGKHWLSFSSKCHEPCAFARAGACWTRYPMQYEATSISAVGRLFYLSQWPT